MFRFTSEPGQAGAGLCTRKSIMGGGFTAFEIFGPADDGRDACPTCL